MMKPSKWPPEAFETGTLPTWEEVKKHYSPEYWARQEQWLEEMKKVVAKARAAKAAPPSR
jgi:hypothetical protein